MENDDILDDLLLDPGPRHNVGQDSSCWTNPNKQVPVLSNLKEAGLTPEKFLLNLPCRGHRLLCAYFDQGIACRCPIILSNPYLINTAYREMNTANPIHWKEVQPLIPLVCNSIHDSVFSKDNQDYLSLSHFRVETVWTMRLAISSSVGLTMLVIDNILQQLEEWNQLYSRFRLGFEDPDTNPIRERSSHFGREPEALYRIAEYNGGFDVTCMMKGLALTFIHDYLITLGSKSHLIQFGDDALGYNTYARLNFEDTKFELEKSGTFCVFSSGNYPSKGNHIKPVYSEGDRLIRVYNDIEDPVYYDAIVTRDYANNRVGWKDCEDIRLTGDVTNIEGARYVHCKSLDLMSLDELYELGQVIRQDLPLIVIRPDGLRRIDYTRFKRQLKNRLDKVKRKVVNLSQPLNALVAGFYGKELFAVTNHVHNSYYSVLSPEVDTLRSIWPWNNWYNEVSASRLLGLELLLD